MDQNDKEKSLAWFQEARFGMFIHWGPYSLLAGEWNGRQVPVGENAEWIMQKLEIPVDAYRQIAHQLNPVAFDAQAWVALAKAAGMKYLVITAKHHDGFAMYHSQVSEYNIVDATPYKRDPMPELAAACREAGIRFCFYYSHREDWDHPDAYGNDWNYDDSKKDFERYLEEKSKPQLRELLTNYGPLGLIWFDRGLYTQQQAREFYDIVHELQPECLVNGRVGGYEQELVGDYQDLNDNGMPIGGIQEVWETPQTLNETWGYSRFDTEWKSHREVIRRLVEIASRGGNYLLNIGPTAEGVIPEATVEILTRVGEWVSRNGESIYGTTAGPFADLPWGYCTVKDQKLYLHVFDWPQDGTLQVRGLRNVVQEAYLLADKTKLSVTREDDGLFISVPKTPPDEVDTVVVVRIEDAPDVDPPVVRQAEDGTITLDYVHAVTSGKAIKRFNRRGRFHISKWTGPEDAVTWHVDVPRPGTFKVTMNYAAQEDWAGREYELQVGDQRLVGTVECTGDWYTYQDDAIGTITLAAPARYTLQINPTSDSTQDLMYFKAIQLVPADRA
ncbi:MAG: alpha-L-fucosidase [Anaerolineae bacterium]|nr:alpha-L-fucosidase [Anaerolineae bacterium]